jgi:hypothetical protein
LGDRTTGRRSWPGSNSPEHSDIVGAVALVPGVAAAVERGQKPAASLAAAVEPHATAQPSGLCLDRLSKGDLRIWRAIEEVVAASDLSGAPRSPSLRRLWDWARASTHVIHVEMVPPSRLAAGMAGVFRVESTDLAGLRHVAVIRLCPSNIQRAKVATSPDAVKAFARFDGLTEAERYAEVLAHELAHAEYNLENRERVAELEAAQAAIAEVFARPARGAKPAYEDLVRRCEKPLVVLAAGEAHAQSVEAVVLRELAGKGGLPIAIGQER